jgi:hypothetical protein
MKLEDIRKKVLEEVTSCYLVKCGKIYEFKIAFIKGKKDVSPIQTSPDGEKAFFLGFENPQNKKIWKLDYAQPVIVVTSIEGNGRLSLSKFSKGGFDIPNAWFTIKGDFFLDEESAKRFANS